MSGVVLNTNTLPLPIRERIHAAKVTLQEHDGGVILMPFHELSGLRGIAKGSQFTTEKLFEERREEKICEDRKFGL